MPPSVLSSIKRYLHPPRPDPRGRRFVAVIECLLNQNARDDGAASAPALDARLVQICHDHQVGILQMPCPEIHVLGFCRQRARGQRIREALNDGACVARCQALAQDAAARIEVYLDQGYALAAVLGGNPESPGCAVHQAGDGLGERSGLLMRQLQGELRRGGYDPVFLAIRDHDPELHRLDLAALERLLSKGNDAAYSGERPTLAPFDL